LLPNDHKLSGSGDERLIESFVPIHPGLAAAAGPADI
jgi:hypothetical protein